MWAVIIIAMFAAAGVSLIYLAGRFARFGWLRRITGKHKVWRYLLGLLLSAALLELGAYVFGIITAMVAVFHVAAIWLLCDLCFFLRSRRKKKKPAAGKEITAASPHPYYAGIAALMLSILYLSLGWYQAHHVWQKNYTVKTEKNIGNFRLAYMADAHVGTTFSGKKFGEHMKKLQKSNPDAVFVVGDFVDDRTSRENMEEACRALGELETNYGVYFVMGNHDRGYNRAERGYGGFELIEELEKNHVTVLQDETVLLDDRIYVTGRRDASSQKRALPDILMENHDPDKYTIILDHQPHEYDELEDAGADLVLSGHTHAGQLFPINYVGEWTKTNDKTYGLEKRGNTNFIVTSGISAWEILFKTGCRSEYVVVDIEGAKK